MTSIFIILLSILALASALRIIIGPTIWDRLLGLNLFSSKVIMLIVLLAMVLNKSYFLDIAIVYTLLGFISTVFTANFIQKNGKV